MQELCKVQSFSYNSCDDLRDIPWDDALKERNINTAWSNWKSCF